MPMAESLDPPTPGPDASWAVVFDRLIPADAYPAVSDAGLLRHLQGLAADDETRPLVDRAGAIVGQVLAAVPPKPTAEEVDAALAALAWDDREHLIALAVQAYYGGADTVGARMVGFAAGPKRVPLGDGRDAASATATWTQMAGDYDVVVIGAGAGGGVAAQVVAEFGARVLILDRGGAPSNPDLGRDHLRNHRSPVLGSNTGPATPGNPRVLTGPTGDEVIARTHDPRWHNNAMVVGGGTRVFQGMAWRFHPTDFAMASTYGTPDDSSLADWPITYADLAPHYDWVEQTIGVCGDGRAHAVQGVRTADYPMPPLPTNTEATVLAAGAQVLGLRTGPVPLAINSVPRDGRAQCVRCGECVGFACVVGAKNGTADTAVPAALATGNATLVAGVRAVELTVDAGGAVTGVVVLDEATGARRTIVAGAVVVAAGAIETARLLLASRSAAHPAGIGNAHDQVGRHLQGHSFGSTFGRFADEIVDMDGPGCSIATCDHVHGNEGIIGGGVIANEMIKLPIVHWNWAQHPAEPRWGLAAKASMRDSYRRTGHLFAQVQEIPRADNRVTLASVTDAHGVPVAHLAGHAHPETIRAATRIRRIAETWMAVSGALDVWSDEIPTGLTAGQHQAGTARMGTDPTTSVTDPDGRVHGHANLYIADGSVHVTNGGFNPSLTIMALARRTALGLAR